MCFFDAGLYHLGVNYFLPFVTLFWVATHTLGTTELTERTHRVVQQYDIQTTAQYLRGIAHSFNM